jgi:uncharacterized protein (DUF849 family)
MTEPESILARKVIVTCALTGVAATRKQCPAIPYTPAEIGEEARRAYEAGASVVHIHAREDDGSPSHRVEVYGEIMKEVRKRSPVLINFSTGAVEVPKEERVRHITELRPEIGALNMGSMNYAKYNSTKKGFVFNWVFENSFDTIQFFLDAMVKSGVKPELECFDMGHCYNIRPFLDMGLVKGPLQFSFIMGVLGGVPAPNTILSLVSHNFGHLVQLLYSSRNIVKCSVFITISEFILFEYLYKVVYLIVRRRRIYIVEDNDKWFFLLRMATKNPTHYLYQTIP